MDWRGFGFLYARYVLGTRTLFALHHLKADFIANLKLIKRHTVQILGMEEKILRFAFASDETKPPVRQSLYFSRHDCVLLLFRNPTPSLFALSILLPRLKYVKIPLAVDNSFAKLETDPNAG